MSLYFFLISSNFQLDIFPTPTLQWLNHPLVVGAGMTLCVVGYINAGNMADGANGLLSTIAIAVLLVGYLETGSGVVIALMMSTIVFSLFNVVTGSMFLGDSGAYFLSAIMALICVDLYMQGNSSVWFYACLLSYPCVELIRVLYVRWRLGGSLLAADNNHLHNMLFEKLKSFGVLALAWEYLHRAFVSDFSTLIPLTGYLLDLAPLRLTSLAVGLLLVLRCACAFSAIFRFAWKKLAFAPIRKAVIPMAGLGIRMLAATKAIPKELLPVYDRPIIEHVVKEAIAVSITETIRVTRRGKEAIENHYE